MARSSNQLARELLRGVLARSSGIAAAELARQIRVSVPTLHRMLGEQRQGIIVAGRARRARYALQRALRGRSSPLPLYEVAADGSACQVAELMLVHPQGTWFSLEGSHWPVPEESRDGWWPGLPYPLFDMRAQGYLGRQLALAEHRRLGLAPDPEAWSEDDIVHALVEVGSDTSGSLILGQPALEHWQQRRRAAPQAIGPAQIAERYAELAEQAVAQGVPGSSAAGEFPKFPALRELDGSDTPHVLVKFSGSDGSAAVVRWADLLVCEHLALEAARTLAGVTAARSRIVRHDSGRTFLEAERFDRHGLHGRSPLVSLGTLDAALIGSSTSDWRALADRLAQAGWLGDADRQAVHRLWWFGRLIGNSDMHTGNLSFRPVPSANTPRGGMLALAPIYDMLPMLFAPLAGGELPTRRFEAPLPLPPERDAWLAAGSAALRFWRSACVDERISVPFRAVCEQAMREVEAAAALA